jgi:hypothetical protein
MVVPMRLVMSFSRLDGPKDSHMYCTPHNVITCRYTSYTYRHHPIMWSCNLSSQPAEEQRGIHEFIFRVFWLLIANVTAGRPVSDQTRLWGDGFMDLFLIRFVIVIIGIIAMRCSRTRTFSHQTSGGTCPFERPRMIAHLHPELYKLLLWRAGRSEGR